MVNSRTRPCSSRGVRKFVVSVRFAFHANHSQSHELRLLARLYSAREVSPRQVRLPTHDDGKARYPVPEYYFHQNNIQPYVHDCNVIVTEGSRHHRFRVFFKCHPRLAVNLAMPVDAPGSIPFRGDILVMRRAEHGRNVVNMRPGDARIADMLVPR